MQWERYVMQKFLASAALVAFPAISCAAIAPFTSGNGELFFVVQAAEVKASYTKDLGIYLSTFLGTDETPPGPVTLNVNGRSDAGVQIFFPLESDTWNSFVALAPPSEWIWAVHAGDSTGNTAPGAQRLLTTASSALISSVRVGAQIPLTEVTNGKFSLGTGSTQANNFFSAIQTTGTHGAPGLAPNYSVNGESVNFDPDPGSAYYGSVGGLSASLNGNFNNDGSQTGVTFPFNPLANAPGTSSWFYYLTRSGSATGGFIQASEFDNGAASPTGGPGQGYDGYWGFVFVAPDSTDPQPWKIADPTSPYVGKWLLSYTLPPFDFRSTASFREFAQGISRTEYSGGFNITHLAGAASASPLDSPAGWVRPLGAVEGLDLGTAAVTAVPEPATWALWLAAAALFGRRAAAGVRRAR
jgi:hypothetical protein